MFRRRHSIPSTESYESFVFEFTVRTDCLLSHNRDKFHWANWFVVRVFQNVRRTYSGYMTGRFPNIFFIRLRYSTLWVSIMFNMMLDRTFSDPDCECSSTSSSIRILFNVSNTFWHDVLSVWHASTSSSFAFSSSAVQTSYVLPKFSSIWHASRIDDSSIIMWACMN